MSAAEKAMKMGDMGTGAIKTIRVVFLGVAAFRSSYLQLVILCRFLPRLRTT